MKIDPKVHRILYKIQERLFENLHAAKEQTPATPTVSRMESALVINPSLVEVTKTSTPTYSSESEEKIESKTNEGPKSRLTRQRQSNCIFV